MKNIRNSKRVNKPSTFRIIFTSTLANVLIPFLSLYNLLLSAYVYKKESAFFRQALNENTDLTEKLLQMNAYLIKFFTILKIEVPYGATDQPLQLLRENVKRNIISLLDNILIQNDLLGVIVIHITTDYKKQKFNVYLQPANTQLVKLNAKDFSLSVLVYTVAFFTYLFLF